MASFVEILGADGLSYLDITQTAVFAVLLLWLSQSFWTLGRRCGRARRAPAARAAAPSPPQPSAAGPLPRVAVIAPIYNEDTERVFAGFRAMWEDLRAQPHSERLDLLILSDTTDPDVWLAELDAWQRLRQAVAGSERIYYRRRLRNVRRKTGNIEDFITRWGGAYGYMIVLDADSLMSGRAMMRLVERMDGNPAVGLIQAPPKLVRGHTVFARMLQFAGELYGPMSAAGLSYWALGEGNYWGHNAIIRVAPFAELCGLPLLSGRAPLGGEIMSHDFVEAALLRRGGWQVWIADDIGESYEEPPPSIADFATRDRRWCQGNMQHIKVLFVRDLHWVSRLHLAIGILSYLTSPLWLMFLLLSAAQAWELTYGEPVYFTAGWPFPTLPVSVSAEAALLLGVTLGLLFLPKLMGLLLALVDGPRRRQLGGGPRLIASAVLETLLSAMVAPIMMLLHTGFVATILLGSAIDWQPQRRQMAGGLFGESVRRFGWVTVAWRRGRDRHLRRHAGPVLLADPGVCRSRLRHPARDVHQLRRLGHPHGCERRPAARGRGGGAAAGDASPRRAAGDAGAGTRRPFRAGDARPRLQRACISRCCAPPTTTRRHRPTVCARSSARRSIWVRLP